MRDDPLVVALVIRARDGDKGAWDEIVERYAPLVWSICRRFRLSRADSDDVSQSVWLRLVEQLPTLREPAALPGWLATTAQRECLRVLRTDDRRERLERQVEATSGANEATAAVDQEVLAAERNAALRAALAQLPPRCRLLLALLIEDPPVPYSEISARLHVPIGSIGPSRARCLERMRRCPALADFVHPEEGNTGGGERHDQPVVDR